MAAKLGNRVRLIIDAGYECIKPGDKGTVTDYVGLNSIYVQWDVGYKLIVNNHEVKACKGK